MTIPLPDFTTLTAVQFFVILVGVAAVDFVTGIIGAIRPPNTFSWNAVTNVLYTHGVQKVLPIGATFAVGQVGNTLALCAAADGLLALYVVQTLMSAYGNLGTSVVAGPPPAPDAAPVPAP